MEDKALDVHGKRLKTFNLMKTKMDNLYYMAYSEWLGVGCLITLAISIMRHALHCHTVRCTGPPDAHALNASRICYWACHALVCASPPAGYLLIFTLS